MIDILLFTALYVGILAFVSIIHYRMGYQAGVSNTIHSLREFEPTAIDSAIRKIKSAANAESR